MSPNEKALKLVKKFTRSHWNMTSRPEIIKCALICVDEILSVIDIYPRYQMSQSEIETVDYWKSVKQELLKLK